MAEVDARKEHFNATDFIDMADAIDVGLAVTSHSISASATCTFDHVSIQ